MASLLTCCAFVVCFALICTVAESSELPVELSEAQQARVAAWEAEMQRKEQVLAGRLVTAPPAGRSYEALVPDTLDLAERGALALNSLTQMLDPEHGHGPYQGTVFGAHPPFLTTGWSPSGVAQFMYLGDYLDVPKLTEALPKMRLMSGSRQDLDRERGLMLRLLATSWEDGLIHSPPLGLGADPQSVGPAHDPLIPRFLMGVLDWYQYDKNALWLEHAHKIYRTICALKGIPGGADDRWVKDPYSLGGYILGLTRYAAVTDNPEALDLAGKLAAILRQPQLWEPLSDPVGVVGAELGHSVQNRETHGFLFALRGLLEYAQATNDAELKRFVRSSYDYWRSFGIPEIGWIVGRPSAYSFTETCAIADMVYLAVKMSDYGVGDYWEDVDQYVRNQLVEQQISDKAQLVACAAASFPNEAQRPFEDAHRAIERSLGSFANIPFVTYYPEPWTGPCCNHNGAQALYQAWESVVRDAGHGVAQVNLLLNRASPQLDVDSYLPYEGKVILRNKTADRIHVRMPNWVSKAQVRCQVAATAVDNQWLSNYLVLEDVKPGDQVMIEFPVVARTFKRTEGASGITYKIHTRGNTVMDIQPRPELVPAKISEGRLVVSAPARMTVTNATTQDVTVSVDARSVEDAGIILRYTGPGDYVLAHYCVPKFRLSETPTIAIYEMVNGTFHLREKTPIEQMKPDIHLTADVNQKGAGFTITDGAKTFGVHGTLENNLGAGAVGLYALIGVVSGSNCHAQRPSQSFDAFSATSADGQTLFRDGFDRSPDGLTPDWDVAALPNNYRFYLRDHMRADKAPFVRKTRFVPERLIRP